MYVKPTAIKRLMLESIESNQIIAQDAYLYLAIQLQEMGFDIVHEAQGVLRTENEHRQLQGLEPKRKLTDSHIRKAIEQIRGNAE